MQEMAAFRDLLSKHVEANCDTSPVDYRTMGRIGGRPTDAGHGPVLTAARWDPSCKMGASRFR